MSRINPGVNSNDPALKGAFGTELSRLPIIGGQDFRYITLLNGHDITNAAQFASWLDQFQAWGYTTVTLDQVYAYMTTGDATPLPVKPLVLTFDDGYLTHYTNVFPALTARGMKATFYIVPDWIDDVINQAGGGFLSPNHASWAQLVEMKAAGMDLQSHGKAHQKYAVTIGAAGAVADFLASKARIEQMVPGQVVSHLAFPNGDTSDAVRAALATEPRLKTARTVTLRDGSTEYITLYSDRLWMSCTSASPNAADVAQASVFGLLERNPNLISDPGHEFGAKFWTLSSPGVALDTVDKHAGAQSVKLTQQAAAISAKPPQIPIGYWGAVNGSVWIKTSGIPAGSVTIQMELIRSAVDNGVVIKSTPTYVTTGGTQGWTQYTWTYRGDNDVYWVRPMVVVAGSGAPAGSAWVDDWEIRRIPRPPMIPLGF